MLHAFPDFPHLADLEGDHSFSLPQQCYIIMRVQLDQCKKEAQCRLEGEYSAEELARLDTLTVLDQLDDYRDQLGYDELLDTSIQAERLLLAWGFEQLRLGPQRNLAIEILAHEQLILKRPRLKEAFIELCLHMVPQEIQDGAQK